MPIIDVTNACVDENREVDVSRSETPPDFYLHHMMKCEENIKPDPYYMTTIQFVMPDEFQIDPKSRSDAVDWLLECIIAHDLGYELFHLSSRIMDRTLSKLAIPHTRLKVIATICLFIAVKYLDDSGDYDFDIRECTEITGLSEEKIGAMDHLIHNMLGFNCSDVTAWGFLNELMNLVYSIPHDTPENRRIMMLGSNGYAVISLARALCHLTIYDYNMLRFPPSLIATACLHLALYVKNDTDKLNVLSRVSGYDHRDPTTEMITCMQRIIQFKHASDLPVNRNSKDQFFRTFGYIICQFDELWLSPWKMEKRIRPLVSSANISEQQSSSPRIKLLQERQQLIQEHKNDTMEYRRIIREREAKKRAEEAMKKAQEWEIVDLAQEESMDYIKKQKRQINRQKKENNTQKKPRNSGSNVSTIPPKNLSKQDERIEQLKKNLDALRERQKKEREEAMKRGEPKNKKKTSTPRTRQITEREENELNNNVRSLFASTQIRRDKQTPKQTDEELRRTAYGVIYEDFHETERKMNDNAPTRGPHLQKITGSVIITANTIIPMSNVMDGQIVGPYEDDSLFSVLNLDT